MKRSWNWPKPSTSTRLQGIILIHLSFTIVAICCFKTIDFFCYFETLQEKPIVMPRAPTLISGISNFFMCGAWWMKAAWTANAGGKGVKLENLWNRKKPNQLCWLTTHKCWYRIVTKKDPTNVWQRKGERQGEVLLPAIINTCGFCQ